MKANKNNFKCVEQGAVSPDFLKSHVAREAKIGPYGL